MIRLPMFWGRAAALCTLLTACVTPAGPAKSPSDGGVTQAARPADGRPLDLMGGGAGACEGAVVTRGGERFLALEDGTLLTRAPLRVRADGAARAYHPDSFQAGAILHRCNAGEVHLPDGTRYMGGASEAACGRFERDVARIAAAGWDDGSVGAVRWFGIAAEGAARVAGQVVPRVRPVLAEDGFYVSRTPLRDEARRADDPSAYPDAARVPYVFTRRDQDVALGSFGVALRARGCPSGRDCAPVPFVVAGRAASVGDGSIALARASSGLAPTENLNRQNRYRGQADRPDLLYVFFGGAGAGFAGDSAARDAAAAFEAWGGADRLAQCRRVFVPEAKD